MSAPAYVFGKTAALRVLGFVKSAEYAPGIPKRQTRELPTASEEDKLRWILAVQDHKARRAGRHYDVRLVDPDAGLAHSWAVPKARLPSDKERLLAVQTWTHAPEYALNFGEGGPRTIGKGYGSGTVELVQKEPVDIVKAHNDLMRFRLAQNASSLQEYLLRRTHGDKWLFQNVTPTTEGIGTQ